MLAAYRLAVLHATEDVENAFSALLKREEQSAALARGSIRWAAPGPLRLLRINKGWSA
jgi:hypothetical protein